MAPFGPFEYSFESKPTGDLQSSRVSTRDGLIIRFWDTPCKQKGKQTVFLNMAHGAFNGARCFQWQSCRGRSRSPVQETGDGHYVLIGEPLLDINNPLGLTSSSRLERFEQGYPLLCFSFFFSYFIRGALPTKQGAKKGPAEKPLLGFLGGQVAGILAHQQLYEASLARETRGRAHFKAWVVGGKQKHTPCSLAAYDK